MKALQVERLGKAFGGLTVLKDISLTVDEGERRAILGPNGAGKTTFFNLICGALKPTSGRILVFDHDITGLPPHALPGRGLARTFQRNNLFPNLTVWENVRLAVQQHHHVSWHWFRSRSGFAAVNDDTADLMDRLGLSHRSDAVVRQLSYGEQRQVEVAMALAARPRVLLLDEPTAGMSQAETAETVAMLKRLPRSITLLIIEHDMDVVSALADSITVFHYGLVLAEGPVDEVKANPQVLAVYLGTGEGQVLAHA